MFLDKGFAYIGYAPIFVSELVLGAGFLVLLSGGVGSAILRSPITWALLAYASWGAATALPSIASHGMDAMRDSVIWAYSAFALIVSGVLLRTNSIERPIDWYGRWMPWFLLWVPIGLLIYNFYGQEIPFVPGNKEERLLTLKSGDLAVHLAGAIPFLALGLNRLFPETQTRHTNIKESICWVAICVGSGLVVSSGRSALLTLFTVVILTVVLRPTSAIKKLIFPIILILTVLTVIDFRMERDRPGRDYSLEQITSNLQSMVFPASTPGLTRTARWRLDWWEMIIDYTVFGDYFWTGKGYGVNLAVSDGFLTGRTSPNRNPHNGHITILARSGVPGLILWCILQATILIVLLRHYSAAKRARMLVLANVNLWLILYWLAFIVNMSFDVYLEGPQGGIWFWCLVGYAIALTVYQDALEARPNAPE